MYRLTGKRILLGVTGGIAAYKTAVLLRLLQKNGADVQVVMTRGATEFVTPLTFQALSGKVVHTELLDLETESAMGHIELARWADVILIAPASANFIARVANGYADDLLSTLCLAADVPILVAPAMNQQMWLNAATQENLEKLKTRGVVILGPAEGDQACGENGPGRMLEADELALLTAKTFETNILTGSRILVTAGPTREAIDPVRYISNRSSGKMGYAVAMAALEAGADVSLISGPVNLPEPERVKVTNVSSAAEMHSAVMQKISDTDIFISAAAVADYSLETISQQKIKKSSDSFELKLKKNPDILLEVAALQSAPFSVGFAAETENLESNAQLKLRSKKLDMIAANLVGDNAGFDVDTNAMTVFWKTGQKQLQQAPKNRLARNLISLIADQYNGKNTNKTH
ncbi:MAG TPA: bifunctional phosphopantothenoylcysteine decarboxylase/phosphopantothenate--cysteine ligase CoaBC [Thiotrichaceae bacterium]|jgi:phosphopantothenoylcysteine decarboxylase/phosphopantothenate--cysteine ligase|nr:bifunctional phosphopantothenoylcysteine decarboxylase/phosphopantothenate--cysteine ligase CoaBC [Thiotrichaceae bacterium]HIM08706.1 bifunctional phosphopantothenoylcysteine decarboxylase/phosphopantothenate--cysteine ligase CoaBC [Gammaproteobacteria bacterium]